MWGRRKTDEINEDRESEREEIVVRNAEQWGSEERYDKTKWRGWRNCDEEEKINKK